MSGSKSSAPGGVGAQPELAALGSASSQPLGLTVHSLPTPGLVDDARARHGRLKMLLVLLVCAAPVIASYVTYYFIRPQGRSHHGELVQPQRPLPSATQLPLVDARGASAPPVGLKGQWLLVVTSGGACDALCERQLYLQRQLREVLGKNKDRIDRVWLIDDGVSPRAELAPALEGVQVLQAPRAAIAGWLTAVPGRSVADHLHLVDPLGNYMMRFPAPSDPAAIKRDLDKLLRAASSWDEPGRAGPQAP